MKRTILLVILDGWGIGLQDGSNPIHIVNPENINAIKHNYPLGALQTAGISVGLPWGEEGNSEVGHLNLGAGKVLYQYYPKISIAIQNKTFFENKTLKGAFAHAKEHGSAVNIVGLLGTGNVHSSFEHLQALLLFAEQEGVSKINLHLCSDGVDSAPQAVKELLAKLPQGMIASLSGRFFGMDRDNHWDRTEKAYRVLTGDGPITNDVNAHIAATYEKNLSDEYIEPTLVGPENRGIKDNDAVIFFDFRSDRTRQMTAAFIQKDFNYFKKKPLQNCHIVTMARYNETFDAPVAFEPDTVENPLGKILGENGKIQIRIAESEKYPHITYFFNGTKEQPFPGEFRLLIPSKQIGHVEEDPSMMASEITNRTIEAIQEGAYDFMLINYANSDMLAHTGSMSACKEAVKIIDKEIGKLMEAVLTHNAVMIITSDHGNIERVIDPYTGIPETKHNPNPVPIYLIGKEFARKNSEERIHDAEKTTIGILADVAPTILDLIGIRKPEEMTGQSLLRALRE